MKKVGILIILIIILGLIVVFVPRKSVAPGTNGFETYSSETYGISFSYPKDYVLTEAERGTGERGHYSIVLVKKEDAQPPVNGEGPTAITIDIFQNNIDKQSLDSWFHNNSFSNSKLTYANSYATTTIEGKDVIGYRWSGLYEGESLAFEHKDTIVMLSVTYLSPEDKNIKTFQEILQSLKLKP